MLTDDEARRLLQHAGETVTVDPIRTLPEPPRRPRWPVLVAAAAVVAIAVTSVVIADRDGSAPDPAPAPPGPTSVQVPSVLGYQQAEAIRTLTDAGFIVSSKPVPGCETAGTVHGTEPAAGTDLDPDSKVVLQVSDGAPDAFCVVSDLGWQLLAFADDRGPAPELADTVHLYYPSRGPVTITREQAADPETWRMCRDGATCPSFLARLSEAAHRFYPTEVDGRTVYKSPSFSIGSAPCRIASTPAELRGSAMTNVEVVPPGDKHCGEDFGLEVYVDGDGAISAVVFRSGPRIPIGTPLEGEPTSIEDLAHQFDAFARGHGDLPPIGDEVDLYVGNAFTGFVTKDSATDRKAWATCTEIGTYAGRDCPFSPLEVLRDRGGSVAVVDNPDTTCLATFLHAEPRIGSDSVAIVPTRTPPGCVGQFAVQLFVNDDGELIAVDLLLSRS